MSNAVLIFSVFLAGAAIRLWEEALRRAQLEVAVFSRLNKAESEELIDLLENASTWRKFRTTLTSAMAFVAPRASVKLLRRELADFRASRSR